MSKSIKATDLSKAWNRSRQKSRSYALNSREPDKLFLIFCEGQNTEPDYFGAFPLATAIVKAIGRGETKTRLVESAFRKCQQSKDSEGREIWIVFDMDLNPGQAALQAADVIQAIHLAEQKGFKVAFSNDAFELWVLLHYQEVSGPLTRNQLFEKLSHLLKIDYEKHGKKKQFTVGFYQKLLNDPHSSQQQAIRRARKLIQEAAQQNKTPFEANPLTTVVNLVEALNQYL